ncbi:MAG TPA: ABC transporter substrate-binding protein [Gemmatimonadaceae bacterium]
MIRVRQLRNLALLAFAAASCNKDNAPTGSGERVVSVSKQINEFMYAIGAQDVIVGRDLTSIFPAEIKALPSVGYHRALSAEGITSLKPTLFLTDGNVGPESVIDQLKKVGIPVLTLEPGKTPDTAQALMLELGKRFHREASADSVVAKWKADMAAVGADSAQFIGKPVRVLIMHFGQLNNNYLGVASGSPADVMLHLAGGVNAIDSVGRMTRLTPELIAKTNPDVIIATDVGYDRLGSAEKFAELPGVSLTPAGRSKRIYRIDETEVMYFGPRTPATIVKLRKILHPELQGAATSGE